MPPSDTSEGDKLRPSLSPSPNLEESSSEDDEAPSTEAVQPQTKRKVLNNLQFSRFIRDHQEKIYSSIPSNTLRDDEKSMYWLVREAESEKIISSPREYQTELFERAKQKNIIAVLDTGTPAS